jgi:hypothetical protein
MSKILNQDPSETSRPVTDFAYGLASQRHFAIRLHDFLDFASPLLYILVSAPEVFYATLRNALPANCAAREGPWQERRGKLPDASETARKAAVLADSRDFRATCLSSPPIAGLNHLFGSPA